MLAPVISALVAALVVEDQAALRAAPQESTPRHAVLWRGDWLEVRGERAGFLQVYDHRRERPGYVRPWQVRTYPVAEESAPALRTVIDFLRDMPGAESLGIGYAALYLKAAPAGAVGPDLFDALGTMADRLGRRADRQRPGRDNPGGDAALAAHLEVAASYGLHFASAQQQERTRICYDGEAFRRVLALGGTASERARAALALTRHECSDVTVSLTERQALLEWRMEVLERAEPAGVPPYLGNRLRLRRATALSELAFHYARRGEGKHAAAASEGAVRELALVSRPELPEEDAGWYDAVAVRVGAARWAGEPWTSGQKRPNDLHVALAAGQPGETCVKLLSGNQEVGARCTYGLVWAQSARVAPHGSALALAVQPLPGWIELWVWHRPAGGPGGGWRLDTLLPAATDPELGYVEAAGFSPDGSRLLVAREAQVGGALRREFQVLRLDTPTLAVEKQARSADRLLGFRAWQAPDWKSRTIALR